LFKKQYSLKILKYPLLFSGITFLVTLSYSYLIVKNIKAHEKERFDDFVTQLNRNISFRMQTYINALTQTKSMFSASDNVSRKEFQRYVENLDFLKSYPGIQGIGYSKKIDAKDLNKHEREVRAEGFKDYKVWPEGDRSEYFTILYLEPFNWRNKRAFGFDMSTESIRKAAMEKARDTGLAAVTGKVTLVQETTEEMQSGFLIYIPFYKNHADLSSMELRRRNLSGFIYAPFRAHDLFEKIKFDLEKNVQIAFEIYVGDKSDQLIYQSQVKWLRETSFHSNRLDRNWPEHLEY
jgi:CHASE1-domain containing sensor protein